MKCRFTYVVIATAVLVVCPFISGCLTGCEPDAKQIKEIMKSPPQQRPEVFAKMSPSKQLEIYFYGQHYEPPYDFHFYLAPNWKSLLPTVKERLISEPDEKKVADMLALLEVISVTQCSLAKRADVLDAASEAVAKLRIAIYIGRAKQALVTITHPSKPLPPCE